MSDNVLKVVLTVIVIGVLAFLLSGCNSLFKTQITKTDGTQINIEHNINDPGKSQLPKTS